MPLSPVSFVARSAELYPDKPAVIHGQRCLTWSQVYARSRRLASALAQRGVCKGATVAILAPNIPEMVEAHYGVPMLGAILNTMNFRLDAATLAFQLEHGEASVFLVDSEFAGLARDALARSQRKPLIIDIADSEYDTGDRLGSLTYEALLNEGDPDYEWPALEDEWDAITLNYTSGTTGNPKGVVYHHRGAYLNALGNVVATQMTPDTVKLWSLPMFHCNGWCFNWSIAAVGGTSVCLRRVEAGAMYKAISEHNVNYMCGAAVVLSMFINAAETDRRDFPRTVRFIAAAAPVPVPIIRAAEAIGFKVTHVYGLTETYGPATACVWKDEFNALGDDEQGEIFKRQGMRYHVQEAASVLNPETMARVPADGQTLGEVMFRGNIVMKGYLKNPSATDAAFAGGWFHTGDIGVLHPDGYIELKDRSKDVIISGGENISSIEVEAVLYQHPSVLECAVVAKKDDKWGEIPCAYITLKMGAPEPTPIELTQFCRERLAHYKAPRMFVFGPLPKTSTGKIQKFVLRDQVNDGGFKLN